MIPLVVDIMESSSQFHQQYFYESSCEALVSTSSSNSLYSAFSSNRMLDATKEWLASTSASFSLLPQPANAAEVPQPPTNGEVQLLRKAFAAFYGVPRDAVTAEHLLSEAIQAWERQAPDERSGLHRVRGDCYMALLQADKAIADYTTAIDLLKSPGGEKADPSELPASMYVD